MTVPGEVTELTAGLPDAYRRWRASHLGQIADALEERLVTDTGLAVTGVHGAVYYPPFGPMAALLAVCDAWIGKRTTAGAAFLVVEGRKPA